ncbi:MAG: HindIII family type II restriction endonuclease [Anaerolinea sp.]|nr:HindIII family type II restriction endonuclease [Anaerolinea sp.]
MVLEVITEQDIAKRSYWMEEITRLSGNFGVDSERVEQEIREEIRATGLPSLIAHLRLCGAIPERFEHDSSEEKLYSKYTDVVIHEAYTAMGFTSLVLRERADVADVECVGPDFAFVADAKAFRMSRTAKNQKDFKVQAMDNWKHGKPFAMIVCPAYQLPARTSQIYQQAAARSVCILTYTHLAVFVRYAQHAGSSRAVRLMHEVFRAVEAMNPTKVASAYWQTINRVLLDSDESIAPMWKEEKIASIESIQVAREEALQFLATERERIMRLSREEAIREVIMWRKIENRIRAVQSVSDNGLLEL